MQRETNSTTVATRSGQRRMETAGKQRSNPRARRPSDERRDFMQRPDETHLQELCLRAIMDSAVDAMIVINQSGIIQTVNPATQKLFGYSADELLGRNVRMLMPEPYSSEHDGYLRAYLFTKKARIIGQRREIRALRKDGTSFPISLSVNQVKFGRRYLFTGIIHDLTDRRRLERETVEAISNEQFRIGQDLHDGLCQDLIGVALGVDRVARKLASEGNPEAANIDELAATIRGCASHARQLAHGLNPVDIDAGGLAKALNDLTDRVCNSHSITCAFHWDGTAEVGSPATAGHLYRIAQEAISNATRHGKANHITVSFTSGAGWIVLSIADDGVGLSQLNDHPATRAAVAKPNGTQPGIGLRGMRYRAGLVGGALDIRPRPRGGTIVSCTFPSASRQAL